MDDNSLNQSQSITVRCQYCCEHYPIKEINTHVAIHAGQALTVQGNQVNQLWLGEVTVAM